MFWTRPAGRLISCGQESNNRSSSFILLFDGWLASPFRQRLVEGLEREEGRRIGRRRLKGMCVGGEE